MPYEAHKLRYEHFYNINPKKLCMKINKHSTYTNIDTREWTIKFLKHYHSQNAFEFSKKFGFYCTRTDLRKMLKSLQQSTENGTPIYATMRVRRSWLKKVVLPFDTGIDLNIFEIYGMDFFTTDYFTFTKMHADARFEGFCRIIQFRGVTVYGIGVGDCVQTMITKYVVLHAGQTIEFGIGQRHEVDSFSRDHFHALIFYRKLVCV